MNPLGLVQYGAKLILIALRPISTILRARTSWSLAFLKGKTMLGIVLLLYRVFSTSREPPQPRITGDCGTERAGSRIVATTASARRSRAKELEDFEIIAMGVIATARVDGRAPTRPYAISKDYGRGSTLIVCGMCTRLYASLTHS